MEFSETPTKLFAEQVVASGGRVTFDSKSGADLIIFGRHPSANYGEGEKPPVKIGPGILPVRLIGTTSKDTSRQQFGIERRGNGPFLLSNYSSQNLHLDGVDGGRRDLAPNMQTVISRNTQEMQNVRIGWKDGSEISVQSVGSGGREEEWNVDFVWKKSPVR